MKENPEVHTQAPRGAEVQRLPRRTRHVLEFMPESELSRHTSTCSTGRSRSLQRRRRQVRLTSPARRATEAVIADVV